jgi:hypothetical protein
MSLLAFLGLRCPVRMLPILLFEVICKVIWIAAVAVPHLVPDDIDAATRARHLQPHQPHQSLGDRTPRQAYLGNT